jgi:outer membrane protein assembly factor BamD (BamD/ComL family)
MKKTLPVIAFLFILSVFVGAPAVCAQGNARNGPDPEATRDADVEKDSLHNLDVARQYFKLRKAYVAALQRCDEVLAANPTFSKIDEVLLIAGESSLNLADGRGKQAASLYTIHDGDKKRALTADEFRERARDYLSQLVNDHPSSSFRDRANEVLKQLGGAKPKTETGKQ